MAKLGFIVLLPQQYFTQLMVSFGISGTMGILKLTILDNLSTYLCLKISIVIQLKARSFVKKENLL